MKRPQIIVVGGPTATGKTDIAIDIALLHNGEVINADSRQVYRGLDIGSAKVTKIEMRDVLHHLLDVADPKDEVFSVAEYKKQAQKCIEDILKRGKLPIICGGTGFYIDTLVYNQSIPEVKENPKLRAELETKSTEELYSLIEAKDPKRAHSIDPHNKVRLIRALEIIEALGEVPEQKKDEWYDVLYLCLELDKETHHNIIEDRITKRMKQGMLEEVKDLHQGGVSFETLERFGLEYRYLAYILQEKMTQEESLLELASQTKKFAKRQYTWFKRNNEVKWYNTLFEKDELFDELEKFLSKK